MSYKVIPVDKFKKEAKRLQEEAKRLLEKWDNMTHQELIAAGLVADPRLDQVDWSWFDPPFWLREGF